MSKKLTIRYKKIVSKTLKNGINSDIYKSNNLIDIRFYFWNICAIIINKIKDTKSINKPYMIFDYFKIYEKFLSIYI